MPISDSCVRKLRFAARSASKFFIASIMAGILNGLDTWTTTVSLAWAWKRSDLLHRQSLPLSFPAADPLWH